MASSGQSLEAFLAEARARSNGPQQQVEHPVDSASKKTDKPASVSPPPKVEDGSAGDGDASTAASAGYATVLHENGVQSPEHGGVAFGGEKHDNVASPGLGSQEAAGLFAEVKTEQSQVLEEETLPPEVDGVQVPAHWHAKPCVHVTSIGGGMTEEELVSLFSKYGQISSVSFENEKHDAAVIRYEHYVGNTEELVAQVRQGLNGKKLGDRALIVEPFRPDSLLFIGNLTLDIDDTILRRMFEQHGHVERAFVLRNAQGWSKGYGFVEYSLKSQATTAKMAMGNINMDGRVLRVEWSDCRNVADMFSPVLFIDRLPKDCFHIENSLRELFGKYGEIKDCHLAIGINQTYRGFAFIEFAHSISADRAHQVLDGRFLEGLHIRVSFSNPSKSASYFAQSYKFRYGTEAAAQAALMMKGGGPAGPIPRGPSQASPRFMGGALPGMAGMGAGMTQFGRGSLEHGMTPPFRGSMLGSASGMQGRGSFFLGSNMPPRLGMPAGANFLQRLPYGQGPISITSSAIAQVATAQAKAREEEAMRAEAAKQGMMRLDGTAMEQYQKFQQYKQPEAVQQYAQPYQQAAPYQASMQLQNQGGQQSFTAQQYGPYPHQQDGYYQQAGQQSQQYGYSVQYGQSQGYQYGQQPGQAALPQYQQPSEQAQVSYTQQSYGEQHYMQEQQQSYTTYYQPQAQTVGSVADTTAWSSSVTSGPQQSYEAQWAAYYAGQATYQQAGYGQQFYPGGSAAAYQEQATVTDAGQKRSADQMEGASQDPASYTYPQSTDYSQAAFGLLIQPTAVATTYAQQSTVYQQPSTLPNLPVVGYQQPGAAAADAYPSGATSFAQAQVGAAGGYDYAKRPRL